MAADAIFKNQKEHDISQTVGLILMKFGTVVTKMG